MAKNEKKLKQHSIKNYIILGLILLATIGLTIYLCGWYRAYARYQMTIPVLRNIIPEITELEMDHYIQENDAVLIYLGVPSNDKCRDFEVDLKKLISKRQLKDTLTYFNLENEEKAPTILESIYETYHTEKLNYYPMLLFFEDQEVKAVLQSRADQPLTIQEVEQFLKGIRMGD